MPVANITRSLIAGVQDDLKESWRQTIPVFQKQQDALVKFLKGIKIRNAQYAWKESVPFVKLWPYGDARTPQTFKDRYLALGKYNYELSIPWSKFDEDDDLLGDMRQHVQAAVKRYAQLPDVLISEYFNNSASLNPSILTCWDGAAMFSTTDGDGAARGGVTGGNIVTGTGLSVAGVIHDLHVAQRRFLDFVDPTASKPIFSADDVDFKNMMLIGPNEANEVFQKAANSEYLRSDLGNVTSESNYLKGLFEWQLNPYLSDSSDYYVVLKHPYWKAFVYRSPESIESIVADFNNSDHAKLTGEFAIYTHVRTALGPWWPYVILKINN